MAIRVKTTFLGATDTQGERIRVTSRETGIESEFPYDYSARNAHVSAVRTVFPLAQSVAYAGDHARGHWYRIS